MALKIDCALVLAAGLGTRMRHLTSDHPKPLVEVAGRRLIDRVLDRIADADIPRAVVNVHYKADLIEAAVRQRSRPTIIISDERAQLLETGGAVTHARELLGPAPFLIHNSDSVWLEPANRSAIVGLAAAWDDSRMDCLMLLAKTATSLGFDGRGDFSMDDAGRLARRGTAASAPYVFTGVSIAHPRLFQNAPQGPYSLNLVWDQAIREGRLHGTVLDGQWMHVGTPEAVAAADTAFAAGIVD